MKKIKDVTGEKIEDRYAKTEVAELIVNYITTNLLTVENLPINILVGDNSVQPVQINNDDTQTQNTTQVQNTQTQNTQAQNTAQEVPDNEVQTQQGQAQNVQQQATQAQNTQNTQGTQNTQEI